MEVTNRPRLNHETMPLRTDHYPTVLLTAIVAGLFSIVVAALLVVDYTRRSNDLALELPEYQTLKQQLSQEPDNTSLREQIRKIDFQLREEYFRQRRFTSHGAYLLAGGVVFWLITLRLAFTLRRKLPKPTGQPSREDPDARVADYGIPAVAMLVLLLAGTTFALRTLSPDALPDQREELATLSKLGLSKLGLSKLGLSKLGKTQNESTPSPKGPADTKLPTPAEIARNWPRFRGPRGNGVSAYTNSPTTWDASTGAGILWQTPVPLPGNSSPTVWGDAVFVTGASDQRHEVYCFDAKSGAIRWQKEIRRTPQGAKTPEVSEETGYAASTCATDGLRVYTMFANGDVAALDFNGQLVWTVGLGTPKNIYGHAASLALARDLLIVQFDQGSAKEGKSQLLALRTATGQIAWRAARDVPNSWSSPIVVEGEGQARIITAASPWVIAYRATDGAELWRSKSLRADVGPSPVHADGVVYVVSEFPCLSAIRDDGKGDITKTHVAWTADAGLADTCGPLVTDQFVLLLASFGTLTCYDKKAGGEPLWEIDFDDSFSSSPGLVGNRVYLFGEEGKSWVVEIDRDGGKIISESNLGQPCVTSPAFQDGRIYIRGKETLFCLGTKEEN